MNRGRGGYVTKSRFNAPPGGDFQSDLSPLAQLQTSLQRKPKNNFYETNLQPTRQPPAIALTPDVSIKALGRLFTTFMSFMSTATRIRSGILQMGNWLRGVEAIVRKPRRPKRIPAVRAKVPGREKEAAGEARSDLSEHPAGGPTGE